MPPANIAAFTHQLMQTAVNEPGSLSHLQHAVWGNGHRNWSRTYMNMPRYLDQLLEKCGSRRFYARGELNEPHAASGSEKCQLEDWVPGMWQAMIASDINAPAVSWDAQWDLLPSPTHQDLKLPFSISELEEHMNNGQ